MRAHDWMVFLTTLIGYSLRGVLSDPWLNVFLPIGQAVCGLLSRRVYLDSLDALDVEVAESLALFERYFSKTELTIIFHLTIHAVHYLKRWGPFCSYWMFPCERFIAFCLAPSATAPPRSEPDSFLRAVCGCSFSPSSAHRHCRSEA